MTPNRGKLNKIMVALENAAMTLGALSVLVLGLIIFASVIGREFFNRGVPDDIIMAGLMMIPIIVLPLAFVQSQNGHITVTVATDMLSRRWLAGLRVLSSIIGIAFFGAIGWFLIRKVPKDFMRGNYYDGQLEIPVWPMKVIFAIGIALFIFRLLFDLYDNIRSVISADDTGQDKGNS
jgi:TRAP-type C4-dicarboxylate transport system permease small subunit